MQPTHRQIVDLQERVAKLEAKGAVNSEAVEKETKIKKGKKK